MDLFGMQCYGCGSTNVTFDPKRKVLICNQCGKVATYTRSELNAHGKVVYALENAIRFFESGQMHEAKHYAMDVLNISIDNVPAMYIMAYYDEFKARKPSSMDQFFGWTTEIKLDNDELSDFCRLLKASRCYLADYEEAVIKLVAEYLSQPDNAEELCTIIDDICPTLIADRTSSAYLTEDLAQMYRELAEHCGIPKTCFALLKSIRENPDSPYKRQTFYLKVKSQYFYDHYVAQIGRILHAMRDPGRRRSFISVYNTWCEAYRKDAGI